MPGLLCSFSSGIFLKAALSYNTSLFSQHRTPLHSSHPLFVITPKYNFPPLCLPHALLLPRIYPPSPLFSSLPSTFFFFFGAVQLSLFLCCLPDWPQKTMLINILLSSSTPLYNLHDNYTVLYDSGLGLDVSSLLNDKSQRLYAALFLIPWCLVHIRHSVNNC